MEWIWTTQEQHRLSVFRYMVRNKVTRLSDLMAEFKFSRYMVISVVDQLNEDIARLTGQTGVLVIEKGGADVKIMDRFFRYREVPDSENFSKPGFQLKTA